MCLLLHALWGCMNAVAMFSNWSLVLVVALLNASYSALVPSLPKCHVHDEDCLRGLAQKAISDISNIGVPEMGIRPIDPFQLKNVTVSILDIINITLVDGEAKGIKNCVVDSLVSQVEKGKTKVEYTCDLIIEGKFNLQAASPLFQNLLGGEKIHGDGNAKVELEKIHMSLEFSFHYIMKEDGNIYTKFHPEEYEYDYSIGDMRISADNIFLGDKDVSKMIVGWLNENWKYAMQTFGRNFVDVAMGLFYDILQQIFYATPTKSYIIEDLSSLVKHEE